MPSQTLIFVAIAIALIASCAAQGFNNGSVVPNPIFCRRILAVNPGSSDFHLNALAACATQGKAIGGLIRFDLNVQLFPFKGLQVFTNLTEGASPSFRVFFAIDKAIVYQDNDGRPGYHYLNDTISNEYSFLGFSTWSTFEYSRIDLGGDNSTDIYSITSNLKNPPSGFCQGGSFGVQISPREVYVRQNGTTLAQRSILTPNSFKSTFSLTGLNNIAPGSKIAIGGVLITKNAIRRRNGTDVSGGAIPRPGDAAPGENEVIDIENEDSSQTKRGGVFSWKPYAMKWNDALQQRSSVPLVATVGDPTEQPPAFLSELIPKGYTLKRIWFALDPNGTEPIENFEWDPNLAVEEDSSTTSPQSSTKPTPASSATTIFSMFALLATILLL